MALIRSLTFLLTKTARRLDIQTAEYPVIKYPVIPVHEGNMSRTCQEIHIYIGPHCAILK